MLPKYAFNKRRVVKRGQKVLIFFNGCGNRVIKRCCEGCSFRKFPYKILFKGLPEVLQVCILAQWVASQSTIKKAFPEDKHVVIGVVPRLRIAHRLLSKAPDLVYA